MRKKSLKTKPPKKWCDHNLDKELVCRLCGKEFRRV